jgi:hypothetical protein
MLSGTVVGFIGWYLNQDAKPMRIGLTFLYAGLATFVGSVLFQGHGFFTWAGALVFASMILLFRNDLPLAKRVGSTVTTISRQDSRLGRNVGITISIVFRLLLAAFLVVTGFIGLFATGLSAESGPEQVYFALLAYMAAYLLSGTLLVFMPKMAMANTGMYFKVVCGVFLGCIAIALASFVALSIANT